MYGLEQEIWGGAGSSWRHLSQRTLTHHLVRFSSSCVTPVCHKLHHSGSISEAASEMLDFLLHLFRVPLKGPLIHVCGPLSFGAICM